MILILACAAALFCTNPCSHASPTPTGPSKKTPTRTSRTSHPCAPPSQSRTAAVPNKKIPYSRSAARRPRPTVRGRSSRLRGGAVRRRASRLPWPRRPSSAIHSPPSAAAPPASVAAPPAAASLPILQGGDPSSNQCQSQQLKMANHAYEASDGPARRQRPDDMSMTLTSDMSSVIERLHWDIILLSTTNTYISDATAMTTPIAAEISRDAAAAMATPNFSVVVKMCSIVIPCIINSST